MTTRGMQFYESQLSYLEANDVEGLVPNQYADDAIIVSFDFQRRGQAEILTHFHNYLAQLGYIKLQSTDKFTETDDSIYFEATVKTAGGVAKVYDVFILNDERKATHHFTGLLSFTPYPAQA